MRPESQVVRDRRERIRRALEEGKTRAQIRAEEGLTSMALCRDLKVMGISLEKPESEGPLFARDPIDTYHKQLGIRLICLRGPVATTAEVAAEVKITDQRLIRAEFGLLSLSIAELSRLAEYFGIPLGVLVDVSVAVSPPPKGKLRNGTR